MTKKEIIAEIKSKQLPVIICGAGIIGKALLDICREEGIEIACFCDSSKKVAQTGFCDLDVVYTPDLKQRYHDAVLIISVAAIKDVVDLVESRGFSNWYAGGLLFKDLDITQDSAYAALDYKKFAIENCILCHEGYLNPNKLFIRSVDLIITERCSLRCRDCSNLMQYYKKPADCDTDMLLKSIDTFCAVVDEVMDFRIIGGDAFVSKQWPVIVKRLVLEPKAKRIVLYTNGTIVPNKQDIECLKDNKVLVIATDYGSLSKKMQQLKQVLEQNQIAYYMLEATEWLDCAVIKPHNRSIEELTEVYRVCCAKNMLTLSDGKLFRCPYAANAFRLKAVPDNKNDYVDLFSESLERKNIARVKKRVKDYIWNKGYLSICDWCNGRPLSGNEVKPAIQAKKPLKYRQYY